MLSKEFESLLEASGDILIMYQDLGNQLDNEVNKSADPDVKTLDAIREGVSQQILIKMINLKLIDKVDYSSATFQIRYNRADAVSKAKGKEARRDVAIAIDAIRARSRIIMADKIKGKLSLPTGNDELDRAKNGFDNLLDLLKRNIDKKKDKLQPGELKKMRRIADAITDERLRELIADEIYGHVSEKQDPLINRYVILITEAYHAFIRRDSLDNYETEDQTPDSGYTHDEVMAEDVEKISDTETLVSMAKVLWGRLFTVGNIALTVSLNKKEIHEKYNGICARLDALGSEEYASYLRNREKLYNASSFATKDYCLDYDALLTGDGKDWHGASVPIVFGGEVLLQLIYGHDMEPLTDDNRDIPEGLTGVRKEEETRKRIVDKSLHFIREEFKRIKLVPGKEDKGGNQLYDFGQFHCTKSFTPNLKNEFKKKIGERLKDEAFKDQLDQDSTFAKLLEETLDLSFDLASVLDMRIYELTPWYLAGWSPTDEGSGDNIGKTITRFVNGKSQYIVSGKGVHFTTPSLNVSRFASDGIETVRSNLRMVGQQDEVSQDKFNGIYDNYRWAQIGTNIWTEWHAPSLDSGIPDDQASLRVAYQREAGINPVPMMVELFWPEEVKGRRKGDEQYIRNYILNAHKGGGRGLTFEKYLESGQLIQKFVEGAEAGFAATSNMHQDAEDGITTGLDSLIGSFSPTKGLPIANFRYIANNIYQYCRLSSLAFTQKHRSEKDYGFYYAIFMESMRNTIIQAPTASQKLSVPRDFATKYGIKIAVDKVGSEVQVTVGNYLLSLLPIVHQDRALGFKMNTQKRISTEVANLIKMSVQNHPRRVENNQSILDRMTKPGRSYSDEFRDRRASFFRGGDHSDELGLQADIETSYAGRSRFSPKYLPETQDTQKERIIGLLDKTKIMEVSAKEKQAQGEDK